MSWTVLFGELIALIESAEISLIFASGSGLGAVLLSVIAITFVMRLPRPTRIAKAVFTSARRIPALLVKK